MCCAWDSVPTPAPPVPRYPIGSHTASIPLGSQEPCVPTQGLEQAWGAEQWAMAAGWVCQQGIGTECEGLLVPTGGSLCTPSCEH